MITNLPQLIDHLISTGVLSTDYIIDAFRKIDRKNFVLEKERPHCYEDRPLGIGFGQTISQPTTVAFMLELLEPQKGEKVLDVGSGSGWTTALLAHIVGITGSVHGVERIPELVEFGTTNLSTCNFPNASIVEADEVVGLPGKAPFDRILVSATGEELPDELVNQLKPGGVLVMPVKHAVWKVVKKKDGSIDIEKHEGFVFVPLIN